MSIDVSSSSKQKFRNRNVNVVNGHVQRRGMILSTNIDEINIKLKSLIWKLVSLLLI